MFTASFRLIYCRYLTILGSWYYKKQIDVSNYTSVLLLMINCVIILSKFAVGTRNSPAARGSTATLTMLGCNLSSKTGPSLIHGKKIEKNNSRNKTISGCATLVHDFWQCFASSSFVAYQVIFNLRALVRLRTRKVSSSCWQQFCSQWLGKCLPSRGIHWPAELAQKSFTTHRLNCYNSL